MKNWIYKTLLAAGLMTLLVGACTNVEETLYDQIPAEEFYKDPNNTGAAVGAVYAVLRGYVDHENFFQVQTTSSDEGIVPTRRGGDWNDGGTHVRYHKHEWTPDDARLNNVWEFCYSGIFRCNTIINQLNSQPSLNEEAKRPVVSELRAVRAFFVTFMAECHFLPPQTLNCSWQIALAEKYILS